PVVVSRWCRQGEPFRRYGSRSAARLAFRCSNVPSLLTSCRALTHYISNRHIKQASIRLSFPTLVPDPALAAISGKWMGHYRETDAGPSRLSINARWTRTPSVGEGRHGAVAEGHFNARRQVRGLKSSSVTTLCPPPRTARPITECPCPP